MKSKEIIKNRIVNIDYEKNKISWIYYMPLLLIAGFVPLIVYGKYVDLTGTTQALYWTGQNQLLDFFSYWKSRWVIFLTATALIVYIFLFISKKLPFKKEYKYYIPLGTYAFFAILSTIFAIDVPTALNGFVDMYQGVWVLLSYVTITYLVINFVNSERDVKLFLYAFIFLIIVEGLIGVGQYFGFDIFNTPFGNKLIIPGGITVDGELKFNFGKNTIYGTLFNTNFVGSFSTLMLPMAVVFFICAKTTKKRILAVIALVLCLFTWIGCNSRAGYVGVLFALLVALIILRRYVVKYWKVCTSVCLIALIGLIGFNVVSDGMLVSRLSSMNVFKVIDNIKYHNNSKDIFRFESIKLEGNVLKIKTTYQNLNVAVSEETINFVDDYGVILPMKTNEYGDYVVDLDGQQHLSVSISKTEPIITVRALRYTAATFSFYINDGSIKYISTGARLVDNFQVRHSKFFLGYESFASGRGYIWSRTIPLVRENIVFGCGPDNYVFSFPQDEVIEKYKVGLHNVVVDKPHNMYLQIAVNSGVISLLSLIIVWLIYIFNSIKLYLTLELNSLEKYLGLACLLSVIGYLTAGIFNDHIVSVAPIFWIILGIGISTNIRINKKEEKNV